MQRINQAIRQHAEQRPDHTAMRLGEEQVRYGQLPGLVRRCAGRLAQALPAPDGTRPIELVGSSTPAFVVHLLALWQLGHGVLPQSNRLPSAERQRIAGQAGACATVVAEPDVLEYDASARRVEPLSLRGWLALPSSGTTGGSKVVRREAGAVDAVAWQVFKSVGYASGDVVFAAVPLTHAYGLEAGLLASLLAGARIEMESAFDPARLGERVRETGATILPAVPAMIDMLVQMHRDGPGVEDASDAPPYPHIRRLLCAGAPLPEPLWHACADRLGLRPANYYGATEMGSVCLADPDTPGHDAAWLGLPMPAVSMRVVDPDTHEPVADGTTGEIAVDAPSLMTGYITADGTIDRDSAFITLDKRRYFLTGDLGTLYADGHLAFAARRKLLIEVGANKVNPMEVEAILREHPAVRDALVQGKRLNQTVCRLQATVEPADAENPPSVAELRDHCRHHLAPWKVPRTFAFQALPRTALGKVIRHPHVEPVDSRQGPPA